jgi:hypothetical protein
MRKNHVFRPQVSEILEPRAVPSMAGVTVPTGIEGISVTLPKQISLTNPQVQAAFTAFDQSYIQAVDTLLATTGPNGLVVTSSSRAAFVSSIEESLQTFAQALVASLGTTSTSTTTTTTAPVSTTTPTTTTPSLSHSAVAKQVVSAIVGGGSTSLESQILALSIEQIESQVPTTLTASGTSNQALVPIVVSTAEQVRPTTVVPVAETAGPESSTDLGSTLGSSSSSSKAGEDVRSAFGGFLNDYFKAVQGTLMAAGSNGQVNPSTNRAAFDVKVNQSLQSLETALTASLARYPATSGLGPQIQSAIEGNGPSSLKTQLASLATPQGAQATVVRNFTQASAQAIDQALAAISGDIAKLMGPAGP